MSKTMKPRRLSTPPRIRPGGQDRVRLGVPELPAGKFTLCDGQMAMDLWSDDPDALVDPDEHRQETRP